MELQAQVQKFWPPVQSAIVAVTTIVCGVWMAELTWFFLDTPQPFNAQRITPDRSTGSEGGVNWSQVAGEVSNREYFGEVVVEVEKPKVEEVEAPETQLNLTLQAVIARGEGDGFAVVAQRNGSGKVFAVGDDLFGQASLSGVYGDRVIIDRRGSLETLRYEKQNESLLQQVEREPDSSSSLSDASSFQEAISQANTQVANGGDLANSVRGMVDYVTRRANEDPAGFVQEMGLEPTGGGYQVTRRARQLQMAGLRPGDIVTSVNDSPVGNISSDQALLNQILQTGGDLKIQVRRGSRSFTMYASIPSF